MNNVSLAGNLTKDPVLRRTQSDKSVVSFTLAINEGKDKTEFVNCIAWEKAADLINQYVSKGQRLSCVGKLQTRKWEKDGKTHYATEVVVREFDFPPKGEKPTDSPSQESQPVDELEDEIPF